MATHHLKLSPSMSRNNPKVQPEESSSDLSDNSFVFDNCAHAKLG